MKNKKITHDELKEIIENIHQTEEFKKKNQELMEELRVFDEESEYSSAIQEIENKMQKLLKRKIGLYADFCEYKSLIYKHILKVKGFKKG